MEIVGAVITLIVIGIIIGIIVIPTYFIENLKKNENTNKWLKKNFLWADVQSFIYLILLILGILLVGFVFTNLGVVLF